MDIYENFKHVTCVLSF